jgi:NTP pyrophosphatase (non-canonical NTP hydrolase)
MMDFNRLQGVARDWRERNFPPEQRDALRQTLGVAEETGELAHAILKMDQGIRGDTEKHMLDAADAIGDIVIYLTGVCDVLQLEFDECVMDAWTRVSKRDWVADPEGGGG